MFNVVVVIIWAPAIYEFCPTYKLPPIPTPPVTVNAPEVVEVDDVVFVIPTALLVVAPRVVIVCKVLVFQIVTLPVAVLTAVSVPAYINVWFA